MKLGNARHIASSYEFKLPTGLPPEVRSLWDVWDGHSQSLRQAVTDLDQSQQAIDAAVLKDAAEVEAALSEGKSTAKVGGNAKRAREAQEKLEHHRSALIRLVDKSGTAAIQAVGEHLDAYRANIAAVESQASEDFTEAIQAALAALPALGKAKSGLKWLDANAQHFSEVGREGYNGLFAWSGDDLITIVPDGVNQSPVAAFQPLHTALKAVAPDAAKARREANERRVAAEEAQHEAWQARQGTTSAPVKGAGFA